MNVNLIFRKLSLSILILACAVSSCESSDMIVLMGEVSNSCAKCTENQTCEDGECKDKPEDPCAKCGEDQICMDGECKDKPKDPCDKCGADQTCEAGVCVDKPVDDPCSKCTAEQTCVDGECKATENHCDCSDDQICKEWKCVDKTDDPCAMCNENQTCEDGECKDKEIDLCENVQCGEGMKCVNGICVECVSDDDCDGDWICEDSRCLDPCAKCNDNQTCEEGKCKDIKCKNDAECTLHLDYLICKEGLCVKNPCMSCTDNQVCDGDACIDRCQTDDCVNGCACPDGKNCNGKLCVEACSSGARRCVNDSTLEICGNNGTWNMIMNCDEGYKCSVENGNICVLDVSGVVTTCKFNHYTQQSDILLRCSAGKCDLHYCRDEASNTSEKELMRCAINRNGQAVCVKSDSCGGQNGYVRCAEFSKGIRQCRGSSWSGVGKDCVEEQKICMYIVADDLKGDAECGLETEQCDMYAYRCGGVNDGKIEVCIGNKWRLYSDCSDFGLKCMTSATSRVPVCE